MDMVVNVKGAHVSQACPKLPDFAQTVYHKDNFSAWADFWRDNLEPLRGGDEYDNLC